MDKPKLLIIDDDKPLCESLRDTIELERFLVEVSHTAEDGIDKIEKRFYNIILLDMILPNLHGIEALYKIKRISPDTEVIIFTAFPETQNVIEAMNRNAFSYFTKPFETSKLLTTIQKAYEKQTLLFKNRKLFRQIKDSEREWENTFDAISDLISIHDRDFNIIKCNKAVTDKFNAERKDIIGKKCYEVFHNASKPIPSCPCIRCIETSKTETEEITDPNMGGVFLTTAHPEFDKEGRLIRIVHVSRNITEQKKTLERLKESEDGYRKLIGTAQDAIISIDEDGIINIWNKSAERIFGYSKSEITGRAVTTIMPERYRERHENGLRRFLETGEARIMDKTVEVHGITKEGIEVSIEMSLAFHQNGKDGRRSFTAIIRDITERKQMEGKLMVSYKMASLGRLTAGIFHEVLNPVNNISGQVQLLLMDAEKGSKAEDGLKSIQEEIRRIVKITDGLLRFSRKGKLEIGKIIINDLLENVISIVGPGMKLDNINLIRDLDDNAPAITADSDELRQVFLNLIRNAKDAMPDGGAITIRTRMTWSPESGIRSIEREAERKELEGQKADPALLPKSAGQSSNPKGDIVRISFEDTGCGIEEDKLDKIFDPFFTTKEEGKGTGLGLSTAYGIIENHGGRIRVKSEVGKGTTFTIDLPC